MKLEEWKKRHLFAGAKEVQICGMPGFEYDVSNDYLARGYPEKLVLFVQREMPHASIESVCYFLNNDTNQTDETIEILLKINGETLKADLSLTFYNNQPYWEFTHWENDFFEENQLHRIYFQLFQEMKRFLKNEGRHRLFLVSTTPDIYYPKWLKTMIKEKRENE